MIMINACEICETIDTVKEEKMLAVAKKTIQFCEEYLSSMIEKHIKETLNTSNITFNNLAFKEEGNFYKPILLGEWENGITHRGYPKKERTETSLPFTIDLPVLVEYCKTFGLIVSVSPLEFIETTRFSSYVRNWGFNGRTISISASCPLEAN